MKKGFSIVLNVFSIVSITITLILAAFCVYDWISFATTPYAYSVEFWMIVDYYAVGMLIFSLLGLATTILNFFIPQIEKNKGSSKILIFAFAFVAIISIVLYFLPFNF